MPYLHVLLCVFLSGSATMLGGSPAAAQAKEASPPAADAARPQGMESTIKMREFGYPIDFAARQTPGLLVSVRTGPDYPAEDHVAGPEIVAQVKNLLNLFARWKGIANETRPQAQGNILSFEISPELVNGPWQVAALLGAIDAGAWEKNLDDGQFVTGVSITVGGMGDLNLERVFADLDRAAAESAATLSLTLGDRFKIDGQMSKDWPRDADNYFFDMVIRFDRPLTDSDKKQISDVLELIEKPLSETAFSIDKSAEKAFDETSNMLARQHSFGKDTLTYAIETPTSDISLPLTMLRDIIEKWLGLGITGWDVGLRDAW